MPVLPVPVPRWPGLRSGRRHCRPRSPATPPPARGPWRGWQQCRRQPARHRQQAERTRRPRSWPAPRRASTAGPTAPGTPALRWRDPGRSRPRRGCATRTRGQARPPRQRSRTEPRRRPGPGTDGPRPGNPIRRPPEPAASAPGARQAAPARHSCDERTPGLAGPPPTKACLQRPKTGRKWPPGRRADRHPGRTVKS